MTLEIVKVIIWWQVVFAVALWARFELLTRDESHRNDLAIKYFIGLATLFPLYTLLHLIQCYIEFRLRLKRERLEATIRLLKGEPENE